jgi:3-deoxy-manno-octulosonate cytidylyltransferase (CMP-KDO synthetase)
MIVIPARLGSTRFPSKVLADIMGTPMVVCTARCVSDIDEVVVATDSQEVADIVEGYGFRAILTSTQHRSGTDRIYEAVRKLALADDEVVVNVQADEPFIEESVVGAVYELALKHRRDRDVLAVSAYRYIGAAEAEDPNIVKVVTDSDDMALYFSRAKIPYPRDHHFDSYKGHLGIYGYSVESLRLYCSMEPSSLENIEKLEQLRILSGGYKIAMREVESESFGIDTYEDLQRALKRHML